MVSEVEKRHKIIAAWLFVLVAMVLGMVVLGGVTRLTHSGLSMVEWRPVTGWLPPLGDAEWMAVFEKYQQSPEFQKINAHMGLAGFKSIFWLEFLHRLWGRVIGVVFAVPFAFFLLRRWIDRPLVPKLILMFVLGGLQGLMGWYMVKSGLVDQPDVSQYRLTAHFGLALLIIGYMIWVALGLLFPGRHGPRELSRFAVLIACWAFLTAMSGGFVAGLDAGFAYNTFPLIDGAIVPDGLYASSPWFHSAFEDILTVQFNHRVLAECLLVLVGIFWLKARYHVLEPRSRRAVNVLAGIVGAQALLGITTLLLVVPVPLAAAHQAGAVFVFMTALWVAREMQSEKQARIDA